MIVGPDNSKGEFRVGRCERLCDLSDPLLHHIFGFLLLEELIRTSVLSSRWRSLWASLPNPVFDKLRLSNRRRFLQYVDWALSCRDLFHVKSFSFRASRRIFHILLDKFCHKSINRKVKTLGVSFDLPIISILWYLHVNRGPYFFLLFVLRILHLSGLILLASQNPYCFSSESIELVYRAKDNKQRTTKYKLELFSYIGGHLSECAIHDASVLRDAHLVLGGPVEEIYASRLHKLLKDLSVAKSLFFALLHFWTLMIDSLSIFAMLNNYLCLVWLLFCRCFQSLLKFIMIEEFDATDDQLLAMTIILRVAQILRRSFCVVDLLEGVQLLPRSSDECFISLSLYDF
ncbi:hypothetical protein ACJRO7_021904 [Eucalyptus globulus]|uniref:F-box domain-containing protein n=1 Tax=Eucalyptus globulus TaxID=34317 RepID=A0ABD3KLF6_EUCGL